MEFLLARTHCRRTCQEKHSFGRTILRTQTLPMWTGRQIAFHESAPSFSSTTFRGQFDEAWRNFLMTQPEGTRRRSFGRPSPSTVREVDSHAECFSTTSFRSGLPKRVEEQLEDERYGHRYLGRPVATFSYTSKTAKGWVKDRAIPVAPATNKVTRKEEIAKQCSSKGSC